MKVIILITFIDADAFPFIKIQENACFVRFSSCSFLHVGFIMIGIL